MLRNAIIKIDREVIRADIGIRAISREVFDGPGIGRRGRGGEEGDEGEEGGFELHFDGSWGLI